MSSQPLAPERRSYNEDEIERGLTALALAGNNSTQAGEQCGIPDRTLRDWRQQYPERYSEIRAGRVADIDRELMHEYKALARDAQIAAAKAVALEQERLEAGEVRDAASSARNLTITSATATDKSLLLDDRPTQITEHRTSDQAIEELRRLGVDVVDGTCEDA